MSPESDRDLDRRTSLKAASVLGLATAIVCAFVLAGWFLRVEELTNFGHRTVGMKANAALALLLLGLGLGLVTARRRRPRAANAAFAVAGVVGALQLVQELAGLDLSIDQLLVRDFPDPIETVHPGRMAPLTAAGIVLLAIGGATLHRSRAAWRLGLTAIALVLLLSIHTLFGYAYDVEAAFRLPSTTAMALHTAMCLGVLAVGMIFAETDRGPGPVLLGTGPSSTATRRMVPILLIAPMVLGWIAITVRGSEAFFVSLVFTGQTILALLVLAWTVAAMRHNERELVTTTRLLQANERVFRSTFENAFVGMAHVAPDGRLLLVNDRLAEILDFGRDALLAQTIWDRVHPQHHGVLKRQLQRLVEGDEEGGACELRWVDRRGNRLWLSAQISTVEDEEGNVQHFVFVLDDVTVERKHEEDLLIRTRGLEAAGVGVVITNARKADNPIVYVNQAFEELTGYSASEVLGQNCRFLNQNARDQAALDVVRRAILEGETCTVVLENHRRDGEPFWLELMLTPVFDQRERLSHFIGIQKDMTDLRRMDAEREELLEQALVQQSRAEEAARAREVLLAIVSHELRSPLNSIRLWSNILSTSDPKDQEMFRKAVSHIESNVELQARLVDDLLDVSRISSGEVELRRDEVDLTELVNAAADGLGPRARAAGIELQRRIAEDDLWVDGDRQRLHQVVRNLVENAVKFTPKGGTIELSLERRGDEAVVGVQDSGCGIAAHQLPRVFDQFWQAEDRANRRFRGLGLGLSIVKHIVERHAGGVEVESPGEDQGATFRVRLPLIDLETPAEPRVGASGSAPSVPTDDVGDILILDDERATVEALSLALLTRGFPVRPTFDVPSARAAIAERRPRIVISDLMMPGITGFEFMAELRAEEDRSGLRPVRSIAISGRGNPADRRLFRLAGFDAYMKKPLRIDELVQWLRENLDPAAGPRQGRRALIVGADVQTLSEFLAERGLEVRTLADLGEVRSTTRHWHPDFILADLDFPGVHPLLSELRGDFADVLFAGWSRAPRETVDVALDFVFQAPLDVTELARKLRLNPA